MKSIMKIAISVPDELFLQAEKVAADLNLSRSALYAKAISEMLNRLRDEAVTAQLNAALTEQRAHEPDPFSQRAAYQTAKRAGGNW